MKVISVLFSVLMMVAVLQSPPVSKNIDSPPVSKFTVSPPVSMTCWFDALPPQHP